MLSAAEEEMRALLRNSKAGESIIIKQEEMGHTQPVTPIKMDNSTADGIRKKSTEKCTKAMDMRIY